MTKRIQFIIPGAQKAATTALHAMLGSSAQVIMASIKETRFFCRNDLDWRAPRYDEYHQFFDWTAKPLLRGEATPAYLYWPESLERIKVYNPSMKFIVLLRHPVYRAFSQWRMEVTRRHETLPFSEAIRAGRERIKGPNLFLSYVERGYYGEQIGRLLSLFPRENIHFLKTDALWLDPEGEMSGVTSFLEIDPLAAVERKYIAPVKSLGLGAITREDRDYLAALYHDDLRKAATLTRLNLSAWFDPDYREPMVDAAHPAEHALPV